MEPEEELEIESLGFVSSVEGNSDNTHRTDVTFTFKNEESIKIVIPDVMLEKFIWIIMNVCDKMIGDNELTAVRLKLEAGHAEDKAEKYRSRARGLRNFLGRPYESRGKIKQAAVDREE